MSGKASQKPGRHGANEASQREAALSERYYHVTQRPWPSLLFVLPMFILFEAGTHLRNGGGSAAYPELAATYLIDWCINALGANGAYFPGLLMIAILMAIHLVGKHPWKFDIYVLPGMLGESVIWTVPLFVFDGVLHQPMLVAGPSGAEATWLDQIIRSCGAGLYEELLFRLICITVLTMILVDLFKLPRAASVVFALLLSAGLFAAHHYQPFASESFELTGFLFRTAAGVYLGGLFIFRGYGIAAGCHAFYDIIVVTIVAVQQ